MGCSDISSQEKINYPEAEPRGIPTLSLNAPRSEKFDSPPFIPGANLRERMAGK